ncbi:MAG TPA: lipocalin family protein [Povalibacter sp.]
MKSADRTVAAVGILCGALGLAGCETPRPQPTVDRVDIPRFMGDWYVIANIPTFLERGAHNAVESYRLADDGRVLVEFTFRADSFTGPAKRYTPVGYVRDANGAVWGMQFIWPFKADYRVIYLNDDYTQTIIGREKRDYVWIMSRSPAIGEEDFSRHMAFLREQGYDVAQLQRVPQQQETVRDAPVR